MYKYGVSFNCTCGGEVTVGGGEEGWASIDFVGNDKDKIIAAIIEDAQRQGLKYVYTEEHKAVGEDVSLGDEVVGVFFDTNEAYDADDEVYASAVLFTNPNSPTVIE